VSQLRQRRFSRSRASVSAAREFALITLVEWNLDDRQDDIRLCVSELATNAVLHGVPPGREFCVRLLLDGHLLRLEVRDSGDGRPMIRQPDDERCTRRGLFLVRELADDFGVTEHVPGKTVWASFKVATVESEESFSRLPRLTRSLGAMTTLQKIHDVPVLMCAPEGEPIRSERDALDFIGDAGYQGAQWVVIPVERFDEAFFQLSTRVAGGIIQKFVQYGMGIAVLGDISRHTEASSALRDFVRECNRGRQTWFLADAEELRERLRG
jgi:anti-sigma regulatory factor (Ser/Thr protein kinase)